MKFLEHFTYNVDFISLAGGTGVAFTDSNPNLTIGSDADFLFKRTMVQTTSNVANIKMQDLSTGRFLFKTQEDLRMVAGDTLSSITANGFVPYNWPIPYLLKRLKQMKISVADGSGAPNTVRLAFHGEHIWDHNPYPDYNPEEKRPKMPMTYESSTLAATTLNQKIPSTIQIDDDADFVCTKITGIMTGADGQINLVTQHGMNYHWQNSPTDINNLIGNSQFPHVFTTPRFIPRNSTVYFEFINLVGGANNLTIQLHGYKRF